MNRVGTLKKMPKCSESIREIFLAKQATITAGVLEIEAMRKWHGDKTQKI